MKSLISLCTALLTDVGRLCSVDTARDLITIKSRAQHEGISFLTITLPEFASEFERALEVGQVDSTFFSGWKKKGCLPAFLRGFTSLVFGAEGRLLDEPHTNAVYSIRQVCRVFKKIELPCDKRRVAKAFERFQQTEAAFPEIQSYPEDRLRHFSDVSRILWEEVFGSEFSTFGLVPKHGPGATAERVSGNAKYSHVVWYERLERSFPVTEHYFTSVNHMLCDKHGLEKMTMVPESSELPVRVITVPKTLKAPRIIAIEPVCMQYTQQALSRWIVGQIQRSPLVKDVIRFNDQSYNQRMALASSLDGLSSTLDLSDASDRVPLSLIELMFGWNRDLLDAILACRSRRAQLPDGTILNLRKFASMGSALCFPIESMYFYTIIVHAIFWKQGQLPSRHQLLQLARRINVFGDDIIIPKHETDTVIEALQFYNCKVNTTKSFWNGKFRESCGCDAYAGVDITPVYVRQMRPSTRHSATSLISWAATSNLFHKAGCWQAADFMKREVERVLGSLPVHGEMAPGLGWYSFLGIPSNLRLCKALHKPVVRTYKVLTNKSKDPLGGYPALLKYFLNTQNKEIDSVLKPLSASKEHLMLSARCGTVSRKRHWVSAL